MKWITTDYKGNKQVWYSEDIITKIEDFCQEEIDYFNHDDELQADWKALLERIRIWENETTKT
jgi:hypothetical protein